MRQFDVCPNPSERSRPSAPLVVVLQSHFLEALPTLVIAPMILADRQTPYTEVSARVSFRGETYVVSVAELVASDARRLGRAIGDLRDYEDDIRRALGRLFTGF